MANKTKFQAIKGTRDLLPPETELWNRVEQTAREVFGTYGFGEIRLPIFEPTELFARAVGDETDIVSKEMFSFELNAFEEIHHSRSKLLDSTDDAMRFTGYLFETLRAARSAWDSDRIDHTPANRTAVQKLGQIYKRLYEGIADDSALEAARKDPEILNLIGEAQSVAMDILVWPALAALRPEATASVCRAYIEHGMQQLPQPVKMYYTGPMFRRERPQKGRYRQFYQIGAEVLEAITPNQDVTKTIGKDAAVDAEVIEMVMVYFARLGLEGVQLDINSIGHSALDCRRGYVEKLKAALEKVKDKLGEDSKRRIETNPLRVLDSKLESEQAIIEKLPRIGDHLCAAWRITRIGGWCAGWTTTCGRRLRLPRGAWVRKMRCAVAGAMMGWWNCWAGRRRRASALRLAKTA